MTSLAAGMVIGYLCGSLLPGYWIGKLFFGKDLQREGSGNIGATNAFRVLGPAVGLFVLLLDVAKGMLAVWISSRIGAVTALAGLAAMIGHSFSPFLKFRGGKGVATGLGVFLSLAVTPTLIALGTFALVLLATRRVAPASCIAGLSLGGSILKYAQDPVLIAVAELAVVLILVRHRPNIQRLLRGEEPRLF